MSERGSDLVEAARAVRPYLGELVPDPSALDSEIAGLLARRRAGEEIDDRLAEVVGRNENVLAWVAGFLEDPGAPDAILGQERGIEPLPGGGSPVDADRFACPVDGDFVFYRRHVGQPVPRCPDHGVALVPSP